MSQRTNPTPVALYARVSSDRQDVELPVAAQLRALRDFAEKNSRLAVLEYVDEAMSGRIANRPKFRETLPLHAQARGRRARRGQGAPTPSEGISRRSSSDELETLSRFTRSREDAVILNVWYGGMPPREGSQRWGAASR